ncbi:hypothetical protein ACQ4PT_023723 [Festuca glaucescens]
MPSRSRCGRHGGDADDDDYEVVTVSSDPDESESEAERGAEADDDDEYVADSSDGGGVEDEAEEGGDSDNGDGGRLFRGRQRGVEEPDEERKSQNVDALVRGNLIVRRQPLIPRILSVSDAAAIARKPFKPPCENGYGESSEHLARRLSARKRFVPWGSAQPFACAVINNLPQSPFIASDDSSEKEEPLPPGIEPLILWQPEGCDKENNNFTAIEVDHLLVRYLRPHQREGVQFMFDCVAGLLSDDGIAGCILADDMGLGKTLQSITLLYTLLAQGFDGKPMVKRAVVVTPTSLVSNWEAEISKWLKGKVHLLALCESTRADVLSGIGSFLKPFSRLQVFFFPISYSFCSFQSMTNIHWLVILVLQLIYDTIKSSKSGGSDFDDCLRFFPPELFQGRSGSWTGGGGMWIELSGKMHVLARLLGHLRLKTDDRIVLVSNYTQTLDLFAQLCRERRYPYVRLDGSTSINKRQKLVNQFNDLSRDEFVFLLSSKAGGCGLNLVGGNRLVLFDPDWNPANDKQAAARVWRDGQKKRVYIYRFLSTGTIEEKVYQRQMSKEGLQKVIQQEQASDKMQDQGNSLSTEDLRDLFTFHEQVRSEIHENLKCNRCNKNDHMLLDGNGSNLAATEHNTVSTSKERIYTDIGGFGEISGCVQKMNSSNQQIEQPSEEDLGSWGHHSDPSTVPDTILQCSAGDEVSFVFTNQIDGKLVPVESMVRLTTHQPYGMTASGQKEVPKINSPRKPGRQSLLGKNLKMMGFNLKNSSLKCPTKSKRTAPICLQTLNKTNPSSDHQPQTKRLHVASDISDDDFV